MSDIPAFVFMVYGSIKRLDVEGLQSREVKVERSSSHTQSISINVETNIK